MWELDCEEGWALKNWCFWTVVLEKTPESPMDCKEIQPIHSEGDQPWDFFGRNDAKAETPIVCPLDAKSWLIWEDPDAGRDWGQEEKGTTEDKMVGWHHRLNGHGFGWTPVVGDRQGGLACCGSWGHKESDTTERLNWTELNTAGTLDYCKTKGNSLMASLTILPPHPNPHLSLSIIGAIYFTSSQWSQRCPCSLPASVKNPLQVESVITLQDWFTMEAFILDFSF